MQLLHVSPERGWSGKVSPDNSTTADHAVVSGTQAAGSWQTLIERFQPVPVQGQPTLDGHTARTIASLNPTGQSHPSRPSATSQLNSIGVCLL